MAASPAVNAGVANFNNTTALSTDVNALMPVVDTRSAGPLSDTAPTSVTIPTSTTSPGVVNDFLTKVGSIFKESANITGDVASWVGKEAVTAVEAPVKMGIDTFDFAKDQVDYYNLNSQRSSLEDQQTNLTNAYRSGKINSSEYTKGMGQLNTDMTNWSKAYQQSIEKINHDSSQGVKDTVNTEGDVLTVLTAGIINPAETSGADAGTSAAIRFMTGEGSSVGDFLTKSASTIDSIVGKVPGVSDNALTDSLSRQFLKSTTDTISDAASSQGISSVQIGKSVATAMVLRRPLVFNYLVGQGKEVYDDLSTGKYGNAIGDLALHSAMALSGGPIGWAMGKGGDLIKGATDRVFGQTSFMDLLSQKIGDGNAQGLYNVLSKSGNEEMAHAFKAMEATNLQATHGDVTAAVQRITDAYDGANLQLMKEMDHESFAKDMFNTYKDQQTVVQDLVKGGMEKTDAARAVVGRWSVADNEKLQGILKNADEKLDDSNYESSGYSSLLDARTAARRGAIQALQDAKGRNAAWLNNDYLQKQLDTIISTKEDTTEMIKAIDDIPTGTADSRISHETEKALAEHGHIAILPEKNDVPYKTFEELSPKEQSLVSKFAPKTGTMGESGVFKQTVQPLPVLGSVGKLLTTIGLSPIDAGNAVMKTFNDNLAEALHETIYGKGTVTDADKENASGLLKSLANYVKNPSAKFLQLHKIPITDYRQMTLEDIHQALGVGPEDAKNIRNAIMTSMLKVPLDIRGLGDHIMDLNYKYNPLAKYYSRIQGATRYVFNPFFNWQKTTQTEFLSQFEAGGKTLTYGPIGGILRMLMPGRYEQIDDTISLLSTKGILGSGSELSVGRLGEGDFDQSVGKVGTKLLKGEQQSLASLVMVMADKANMGVDEFTDSHYNEVVDALRSIVSYGKESSILNSPLARTLNFAFFPMRYNLKVSGMMAKYVGKLSAPMQVAFIHSMMQFDSFLKSDEGMAWYAQHSDVIQLFQYISPLYSLDYLNQILNNPESISSYGTLGGLPFGFITQGLDAAGITHFNTPYVSSSDGEVIPNYIPADTRGQINVAIQDLLGQLFTYPGATAGLPSKSGILKKIGTGLTEGSSSDLQAQTPGNLSPQQAQYQKVVEGLNGQPATKPDGSPLQMFKGPTNPSYVHVGNTTSANVPTTPPKPDSTTTKKKKAQFTPQLLPGQSSLGQL